MSTLVAQTISNGTVSTSSANVIQGSAKAWINYKGTATVAIRASYNVSSVTVNGTGDYTINFTNALPDANYSAVFGDMGNVSVAISPFVGATNYSTRVLAGSLRIVSFNTGSAQDSIAMNIAVFR
jgi:hypothetical protein